MGVDLLPFHTEDDVCEGRVVDKLSHVVDKIIHCLIVYFILFQLTDVQDANVVEPLATIESTKDEQLLGSGIVQYNCCVQRVWLLQVQFNQGLAAACCAVVVMVLDRPLRPPASICLWSLLRTDIYETAVLPVYAAAVCLCLARFLIV